MLCNCMLLSCAGMKQVCGVQPRIKIEVEKLVGLPHWLCNGSKTVMLKELLILCLKVRVPQYVFGLEYPAKPSFCNIQC